MRTQGWIGVGVAAVACAATLRAGPRETRREALLRQGAGSYYDVVTNVAASTAVDAGETRDQWVASRVGALDGWLPASAFEAARVGIDYAGLLSQPTAFVPSSADVAAAVKGALRAKYQAKLKPDFARVAELDRLGPSAPLVVDIERSLAAGAAPAIPSALPRRPFNNNVILLFESERSLGRSLAACQVGCGLVEDARLESYVNSVAAAVGRKTERYDLTYHVGILNDAGVDGTGIPGGYVLLTRGLLATAHDEAELACLLAHEMAHINLYHGLREFKSKHNEIRRHEDHAFAELEREVGAPDEAEQELNVMIDESILRIMSGRAMADEAEADLFGVAYASAAGYDPNALCDVLLRIEQTHGSADTFHHHPAIGARVAAIRESIQKYRLQRPGQQRAAERFAQFVGQAAQPPPGQ